MGSIVQTVTNVYITTFGVLGTDFSYVTMVLGTGTRVVFPVGLVILDTRYPFLITMFLYNFYGNIFLVTSTYGGGHVTLVGRVLQRHLGAVCRYRNNKLVVFIYRGCVYTMIRLVNVAPVDRSVSFLQDHHKGKGGVVYAMPAQAIKLTISPLADCSVGTRVEGVTICVDKDGDCALVVIICHCNGYFLDYIFGGVAIYFPITRFRSKQYKKDHGDNKVATRGVFSMVVQGNICVLGGGKVYFTFNVTMGDNSYTVTFFGGRIYLQLFFNKGVGLKVLGTVNVTLTFPVIGRLTFFNQVNNGDGVLAFYVDTKTYTTRGLGSGMVAFVVVGLLVVYHRDGHMIMVWG